MKPQRLWMIALVLALILFGTIGYFLWRQNKSSTSTSPTTFASPPAEEWIKNINKVFTNVTSSSTIKVDDSYRMFFMQDGKIVYADSKDAATFATPISTGIAADNGTLISNPAVIKIKDQDWAMIYEQAPALPANVVKGPGKATQRNLMLAASSDGQNFTKVGIAIDSAKDDKFFASVPDLIKINDSSFRLYYVSQGTKIASAISQDGRSWTREGGFRLENDSVDPDVLLGKDSAGKDLWVMYFATLEGAGNKIYKATSKDGLSWQKGAVVLRPGKSQGVVVDPDVVNITDDQYRMFFGESNDGNAQMGGSGQFDLYYADDSSNIFK